MATSPRIEELRKKFDENPRRYFAPLANEYRKVGDFDQAIFICQEYLPQQPGHMSGHIVFGQALFEAKRLAEAKTVFETALTLDPENLIALRHLADIAREMGDFTNARIWYERVLQADPRNEEIGAIMASMGGGAGGGGGGGGPGSGAPIAAAPTPPAMPSATPKPALSATQAPAKSAGPAPGPASAPTVELSAAAVQEMLAARKAAQPQPPAAAPSTLDDAMTIELTPPPISQALEGLEPTSHSGPIDSPAHSILDAPVAPTSLESAPASILDPAPTTQEMMDIPAGGMLGLETTSMGEPEAPPASPEPVPAISPTIEEFAIELPPAPPPAAAPTMEVPAPVGDGMLDLEPIELDVPAAPAAPASAPAAPEAAPIDGGHDGLMDLEIDLPAGAETPATPPAKASESVPTLVMEAIRETAAPVLDAVGGAMPAIMDVIQEAVPAVVDAAAAMPTIIMDAVAPPKGKEPEKPAPEPVDKPAPFVTETMAQLYLEQGHRDKALEIYRQLVAARPQDAELRNRLAAIESAAVAAAPVSQTQPQATPPVAGSPAPVARFRPAATSVRLALRALLGIDAAATRSNGHLGATHAAGGERGSIDTLFSTAVAEEISPLAAAFDGGYVAQSGSIDAIFTG